MFLLFIISCKKDKSEKKNIPTIIDSTRADYIKINHLITRLNPKSKTMVESWGEYQKVDELIQQYNKISISDALLNAKELSELSQQLKDSIRIEKLNIPSVKIRLNVLYNETLRLADMATIYDIKNSEVIQKNKNILEAYSALNLKINNIISKEKLNKDVNEFIEEIINSDSVKSKKTIEPDTTKLKRVQL